MIFNIIVMSSKVFYIDSTVVRPTGLPQHSGWQDTGVISDPNTSVTISCEGKASWALPNYHGPEGFPGGMGNTLANDLDRLSVVGKFGENGTPFLVGASCNVTSPGTRETLYLGYNDSKVSDNKGGFFATINY